MFVRKAKQCLWDIPSIYKKTCSIIVFGIIGISISIFIFDNLYNVCASIPDKHDIPDLLQVTIITAPLVILLWFIRIIHKIIDIDNERSCLLHDRWTKANSLLSSEVIMDRLNAIYELERIYRDSSFDRWTIVEVLSNFVRVNSPSNSNYSEVNKNDVQKDVQAALNVLGRLKYPYTFDDRCIDLTNTNLRKANLRRAHLEYAKLWKSDLTGANLEDAILRKANMFNTKVNDTLFTKTDLREAKLVGVDLKSTKSDTINTANLKKATYNTKKYEAPHVKFKSCTAFPETLNPESYGMVIDPGQEKKQL